MSTGTLADVRLSELGLLPQALADDQARQLDDQGYLILEDVIGAVQIDALREAFDRIFEEEGEGAGVEVAQMEGVRRLADLVNKDEAFDRLYLVPLLLAAVGHVLQRPFKLHSINGHEPLEGHGLQNLHADTGEPVASDGRYHVVNSMWMLDDFKMENGATRIIPGSHLKLGRIRDYVDDRMANHPDQIHLTGKAGSVAVFNGSVWHSSYTNRNGARRRTLHCAFIAREHPQQTNQRDYLRPETAKRLSPLARYILDVV
jgi:ectoine hydroxylase-related dioxygenase (phytanoyl-CoA dioxygenase family)